jgi:hypothetical protein
LSEVLSLQTTIGDLIKQALKDCGYLGTGQTSLAEDSFDAWARLQWMLQEWERDETLVYHNVTYITPCTGAPSYTVGPSGQLPAGGALLAPSISVGPVGLTARPNRIASAFFRQIILGSPNNPGPIDYPLRLLPSMVDYNRIAYKTLQSFALVAFYDPAWPLGNLYVWPVPTQSFYSIGITVREQLPASFGTLATPINLPFEYYSAMVSNLALRLRPKYGIMTPPGDTLAMLARTSKASIAKANTALPLMELPYELTRDGIYNIYSDQNY